MSNSDLALMYFSPRHIVDFCAIHPIDWSDKDLAKRGGPGDWAGPTKTPAVREFLRLLGERRSLPTQQEYADYCIAQWGAWYTDLPDLQKRGVVAKLYRNFYPSMIDSLHVWALLCQSGWFDACILDSYDDAVGKADLTLIADEQRESVALLGPFAQQDRRYKLAYRGSTNDVPTTDIQMPKERPMSPGNKRWYDLNDFSLLITSGRLRQPLAQGRLL